MTQKIVLVHNTTHYLRLHYLELINSILERGWTVTCVAPKDSAVPLLEQIGVSCVDLQFSRRGMNPFSEAALLSRMAATFRRLRPDTVLNFSIKPAIYGSIAAGWAGVPRICSMITGLGYVFLGQGSVRRTLATIVGVAYRNALSRNHRVFFQNPDDAQYFTRHHMVDKGKAIVLAGTGIDTERFAPGTRPAPDQRVRYLMVARLLVDKGVREYVEAARLLSSRQEPARCALLGPFDDNPAAIREDELKEWMRDGVIDYLGETDDVSEHLLDCDVFVLPSYREGLPRATLEAMSMGKPVVTTDVPGCRETVRPDINGYLVPPRDVDSLTQAMTRFIANRALIQEMGRASRSIATERFDVRKVTETVINAIGNGGP